MNKNIVKIAKEHAIKAHENKKNTYDKKPYKFHLNMAAEIAELFIHLIPEKDRDFVIAGIYEHDTIEDCGLTYNDVKKVTGVKVAELAYALTNEKGRTRKERANSKYYKGIRKTKYASFIKICDRLANIKHSSDTNSRMLNVYKKESKDFKKKIRGNLFRRLFIKSDVDYTLMWEYMDRLLKY